MNGYKIIDQKLQLWDGSPITLQPSQGVTMPQTPNGKLVLAMLNQSRQPNEGMLALTTGGSEPKFFSLESLENAPTLAIEDFAGNNVNLTNVGRSAPIWISLYGPGFGNAQPLRPDGEPHPLPVYQSYTFKSNPNFMRLDLQAPGAYSVFVVYIGSEPKRYAVNVPKSSSIPDSSYDEVTAGNSKSVIGNWLGKTVYVVNLSPIPTVNPEVTLVDL